MLVKIAVTYDNGQIFQHFGHTQEFKVYTIDTDKDQVVESVVIGNEGQGHEALADLLEKKEIVALICGGIGGGAVQALEYSGIRVLGGCSGSADAAVQALLEGRLVYSSQPNCNHHDHEGGCHHEEGGCAHEEGGCGHDKKGGCCH